MSQLESLTQAAARTVREKTGADYALAVSPFPPLPRTLNAAPVEAFVVLAGPTVQVTEKVLLSGNPAIHQSRTAKVASDLLRHHLESQGTVAE
jgi:hypothetical protein